MMWILNMILQKALSTRENMELILKKQKNFGKMKS